ncbi:MAG: chromosome segregation protein SMC [Proteobacteria bacterium]|nr:chromosome segregation protein SMC [Pseudomonadota bacterium]
MQFQRLRLAGFKSFVEATEFRMEPGLTGIVGPNGCGKSNLLESLRWVMGATSARAMRGGGMDDVIFSGSGSRPSRNHAEVALTIDNADRTAPQPFTDHPVLEVTRRIERGAGSTYRLNGREVRAKDVQLLFADASTGANSPALVRQGQISELIAAKPQNRRRILEEAAGVAGLHARRHEAELRLRAAEANLDRLGDVARELEGALNRLTREARQAEKYRRLSAEIRGLQGALLHARWRAARAGAEAAAGEAREAAAAVQGTALAAAAASTRALAAEAALPRLREEAAVAQAVLGRLQLDRERADREEAAARADVDRLTGALRHLSNDAAREEQVVDDAVRVLSRIGAETAALELEVAASPERLPTLEAAHSEAERKRAEAEAEVERLASAVAAEQARAAAERAAAEAARRAALERRAQAEARQNRAAAALQGARREREALAAAARDPEAQAACVRHGAALAALEASRTALEAADAERSQAAEAEAAARTAHRGAADRLGRLQVEARGLLQLLAGSKAGAHSPVLDQVRPDRGYEAALAAALGDDLQGALDRSAPAYWGGADVRAPAWPAGVAPLADHVAAPAELAARLARVGVVDRADGARLAAGLEPGVRLVSRDGELWRWDGFTARSEAPRPAAVRLAQRARLGELEGEMAALEPEAKAAAAAQAAAADRLRTAEAALRPARAAVADAERTAASARDTAERHARDDARREARLAALDETLERLEAAEAEARGALPDLAEAAPFQAPGFDFSKEQAGLAAARQTAGAAREAAAAARAALDAERREREARTGRLQALRRDSADWSRRSQTAAARLAELETRRERLDSDLAAARKAPERLALARKALLDQLALAEVRRARATDALGAAETEHAGADRAARAADAAASAAREARAAADVRLEAAAARLDEAAVQVREVAKLEPEALARELAEAAVAVPAEPGGVETHLAALERERDGIGPVNLRAEEEAAEQAARLGRLGAERADLIAAIAKLRDAVEELNGEGRDRLLAAFHVINTNFSALFTTLFGGGEAHLQLIESPDPLEAGLEIFACPPGKRLAAMSLMSGGEQALTAAALIFAVFLSNPAPVCVLDEVDAPLDDANVDRFCRMLDDLRGRTDTRFIVITHNAVTMSRMDRLFGVTMAERGVSQLVSVDLRAAEALAAE